MAKFKDLTGQVFGRLTVVRQSEECYIVPGNGKRALRWNCVCLCGKEVTVTGSNFSRGNTISCGCYTREITSVRGKGSTDCRIDPEQSAWNHLYASCKGGAHGRNYPFELTREQHRNLAGKNCHYCGASPRINPLAKNQYLRSCHTRGTPVDEKFAEAKVIYTNGVDRKDNARGYTPDNTLPCCTTCNFAKKEMPYDEFVSWINRASNHLKLSI